MQRHTTIPARAAAITGTAVHRGRTALARACLALGVLAAAAVGTVAAGAGPAAAAPAVLYAAAAAAGTGDCSAAADACTLSTALADVAAGGTIQLVTPGGDTAASRYVGNWTIATTGTSATAPVTIEAAPGLASQPVLDGDGPNAPAGETCSTTSCAGTVLTVPAGEYVALTGITVADANNTSTYTGGGLDNSGTVTITGCKFTGDYGDYGGAIDNGDAQSGQPGTGSVTVIRSAFTDNAAYWGGSIDSGDNGGGGTVTVTASTFTGNIAPLAGHGGAIDSGDHSGGGTVTVTGSTFTGNNGTYGGAIDSGDNGGGGTVTVTASTFTSNTDAESGGAINSGGSGGISGGGTVTVTASTFSQNSGGAGNSDGGAIANSHGGSVTVTASTFTGNTGTFEGGAIQNDNDNGRSVTVTASTFTGNSAWFGGAVDGSVTVTTSTFTGNTASNSGGAIDPSDNGSNSGGAVTVTGSTFSGNTAGDGGAIANSPHGSVQVAGDVFDGSCDQAGGTWTDGGYNAGSDGTCLHSGTGDVNAGSAAALNLQPALTDNGGPTQTIAPTTGSPAIGLMPAGTTVTLGSTVWALCPAEDQRGYTTAAGTACDAGAVQTTTSAPLTLQALASPGSFNRAGQVITYYYQVANTGAGDLSGITVTGPAVPGVSCPDTFLAAGGRETCTGTYTITAADMAAGKITGTATVTGYSGQGVPVTSNTAAVTVREGWPPVVTGLHLPAAGAAQGYYLGFKNGTWNLLVTHPGTGAVTFTGTITLNAGTWRNFTYLNLGTGDSVQGTRKTATFQITDTGEVKGFRFATTAADTSITFTLNIDGHPAAASQIFLGGKPTHPATTSPLTFTR